MPSPRWLAQDGLVHVDKYHASWTSYCGRDRALDFDKPRDRNAVVTCLTCLTRHWRSRG